MARPTNEELVEKSELAEQGLKRCRKCREVLPLGTFGVKQGTADGLQPWCKPCTNERMKGYDRASQERDPEKYRERKRAELARFKEKHPELHRAHTRKNNLRKYGLTPEAFDEMLESQEGKCAICKEQLLPGRGQHVDHNHETGAIRGILCNGCNIGLGHFRDDPELLRFAATYLEKG